MLYIEKIKNKLFYFSFIKTFTLTKIFKLFYNKNS